ncbi:hypothetical protein JW848_03120 [Candidatus Bipolaricaulota bacterium]|nr:hypothetical protein [Candidatus Bipolaricaulota bacterium]
MNGSKEGLRGRKCGVRERLAWFLLFALLASFVVRASDAQMYFSNDRNGATPVTSIQEGDEIWIVVLDSDEDLDCDVRDKMWTDVKVIDAKTGARIVWESYVDDHGADTDNDGEGDALFGTPEYVPHQGHWPGVKAGSLLHDFLEETGASTGMFVSSRAFQVGTRAVYGDPQANTHIVGPYEENPDGSVRPIDFEWGGYLYAELDGNTFGDDRVWVSAEWDSITGYKLVSAINPATIVPPGSAFVPPSVSLLLDWDYVLGRFENMDTLMGLYLDPDDASDIAVTMAKIIDVSSQMHWDETIYKDSNGAATIRIEDADENLSCNDVEFVPVFVIVNPGSWNPLDVNRRSANGFASLKRYGGVIDTNVPATVGPGPIDWFNAYDSGLTTGGVDLRTDGSRQPNVDGSFYIQYPNELNTQIIANVTVFDTMSDSGVTRCMFYAQETAADSGVFECDFNDIQRDLGFNALDVGDVLVAYYVDPNDQDDFSLATAYIERSNHVASVNVTDSLRGSMTSLWLGRDPVYVEVIDPDANVDSCCPEVVLVHVCDPHEVDDSEWLVLDELSSNSSGFFSNIGVELSPVWDALGTGLPEAHGGYELQLDNRSLEGFNEDRIYVRYNDVTYTDAAITGVGDLNTDPLTGEFPPTIRETRVDNDVAFAVIEIADTQVFDGETTWMFFLDRQGARVPGYTNSDCVFIEVVDPDQNEDTYRRERIDGYWDRRTGSNDLGQNTPFAPVNAAPGTFDAAAAPRMHPANELLGVDFMSDLADPGAYGSDTSPKIYVWNPRSGIWTAVDLMETEPDSGVFRSVSCIDLVSQYSEVPTLGVLPGDTVLAMYQDPSNHSDLAWIAIKVGIGGGGAGGASETSARFTDRNGQDADVYRIHDEAYVTVFDDSHAGEAMIPDALVIHGTPYDLFAVADEPGGTFRTEAIPVAWEVGTKVTATYVDPSNETDRSSDEMTVIGGDLLVERFVVTPNPFDQHVSFGFDGSGVPEVFSLSVYDMARHLIYASEAQYAMEIAWDGTNLRGESVARGAYIYVVEARDASGSFEGKDVVVRR